MEYQHRLTIIPSITKVNATNEADYPPPLGAQVWQLMVNYYYLLMVPEHS